MATPCRKTGRDRYLTAHEGTTSELGGNSECGAKVQRFPQRDDNEKASMIMGRCDERRSQRTVNPPHQKHRWFDPIPAHQGSR